MVKAWTPFYDVVHLFVPGWAIRAVPRTKQSILRAKQMRLKVCVFLNLRANWILLTQGLSDPILGCLRSFSPHDSQPRVDHVPLILLKLTKIAFNRKHASLGWFLHVWNLLPPFYFTPWKRILKIGGNSTLYQVKHRLYVHYYFHWNRSNGPRIEKLFIVNNAIRNNTIHWIRMKSNS